MSRNELKDRSILDLTLVGCLVPEDEAPPTAEPIGITMQAS